MAVRNATAEETNRAIHWDTYRAALIVTLACLALFAVSLLAGAALSSPARTLLALVNLAVTGGILLAMWLKALRILRLPLLVVASALAGLLLASVSPLVLWMAPGLVVVALDFGLVTLLARLRVLRLERFRLILALLSLVFSLAGFTLVFVRGLWWLTLGWALAAVVCLSLLLLSTVSRILHRMERSAYLDAAAGLFLLNLGLLINVLIALLALAAH